MNHTIRYLIIAKNEPSSLAFITAMPEAELEKFSNIGIQLHNHIYSVGRSPALLDFSGNIPTIKERIVRGLNQGNLTFRLKHERSYVLPHRDLDFTLVYGGTPSNVTNVAIHKLNVGPQRPSSVEAQQHIIATETAAKQFNLAQITDNFVWDPQIAMATQLEAWCSLRAREVEKYNAKENQPMSYAQEENTSSKENSQTTENPLNVWIKTLTPEQRKIVQGANYFMERGNFSELVFRNVQKLPSIALNSSRSICHYKAEKDISLMGIPVYESDPFLVHGNFKGATLVSQVFNTLNALGLPVPKLLKSGLLSLDKLVDLGFDRVEAEKLLQKVGPVFYATPTVGSVPAPTVVAVPTGSTVVDKVPAVPPHVEAGKAVVKPATTETPSIE